MMEDNIVSGCGPVMIALFAKAVPIAILMLIVAFAFVSCIGGCGQ